MGSTICRWNIRFRVRVLRKGFFWVSLFLCFYNSFAYSDSQYLSEAQIRKCIQHIKAESFTKKSFQKSRTQLMRYLDSFVGNNRGKDTIAVSLVDYEVFYFWVFSYRKTGGINIPLLEKVVSIFLKVSSPNNIFLQTLQEILPQLSGHPSGLALLYRWFAKVYPMVIDLEFSVKALINLSHISWNLGLEQDCVEWMQTFLKNDFSIGFPDVMFLFWYRLAQIFHQKEDFIQAKYYYKLFWESSVRSNQQQKYLSFQNLIKYSLQELDYQQVIQYYKQLQEKKSIYNIDCSKEILVYQYMTNLGSTQMSSFLDTLEFSILSSNQNSWTDSFLEGIKYHKLGDIKKSVLNFQKCWSNFPAGLSAVIAIFYLSLEQNLLEEAKNSVDFIFASLGNLIKREQKIASRCYQFVKLLERRNKAFWDPFFIGSLQILSGEIVNGEKNYIDCISRNDIPNSFLEEIFFYFSSQKNCENSFQVFKKITATKVPSKDFYFKQIQCFLDKNYFDKGIALSKELEIYYPFSPRMYNYVGYSLANNAVMLDDADYFIDKALEYDPRDISFWDSKLWVEYKKQSFEKARIIWEQKIQPLGPITDGTIYYHAGLLYESLGDENRSREYWKLSLQAGDFPEKQQSQKKLDRK